ncbi:sigma factor-like helix-turn-helix DNA-binding protein [Lysinibacillus sp. NPDC097231]|uniref:sigma factor-like helix-turn-helix DNA-binding protein n=1 Tax=Lysinibacillus sp. NPDC097231 TaxID=3364142 RepID=UPI0038301FE5
MYQLNESIINSPIFESFIVTKENEALYKSYVNEPSLANKEKLEKAFATHTKQLLAISYLKKLIYFESRRFDKKRKEFERIQPVILNAPTEENITLIDMIADKNSDIYFQIRLEANIEEVITDSLLFDAVRKLSKRQKEVLYYRYVLNWNDPMIAKKSKVSQQAITKSHKKALQKLKEALK